jgi:hypothetical protein
MANYTLTYSQQGQGWTSFHSYYPDWMLGMSSRFYTFHEGKLYLHNDPNVDRNSFYGDPTVASKVVMVFNQDPLSAKMFKTLELETDSPWDTIITTDMSSGSMDASYYDLKEGNYFTYIRRNQNATNLDLLSAQGVGNLQSIVGTTLNFAFQIPGAISVGDTLYYDNAGTIVQVGVVSAHTGSSITVTTLLSSPSPGAFILYIKNSQAESFGARGYYMQVELTNDSTTDIELFSVSSEVFKSYP